MLLDLKYNPSKTYISELLYDYKGYVRMIYFTKKALIISFLFFVTFSLYADIVVLPKNSSLISRVVAAILESEHYSGSKNEYQLSQDFLNEYLKTLDPAKLYFTQDDIYYLNSIGNNAYANLKKGEIEFGYVAYNKLLEKVTQREEYTKKLLDNGFDFTKDEEFEFDRENKSWAVNETELNEIWRKKIKNDIITFKLMESIKLEKNPKANTKINTKTPEERTLQRVKSYKTNLEQNEPMAILELYLSTLAKIYDPHSAYMAPSSEENFNIQMQLSFVGIGAVLSSDDGYVKVEKIIPGGPADKTKNLVAGDKIIAVGEDDGQQEDIVDMPLNKVVKRIRGPLGTNVHLTVLKASEGASAIPAEILIERNTVNMKDSEASYEVTTVVNQEGKKLRIGIIKLPSFYYDFKGANEGVEDFKSSSKDVKEILAKLEAEKVDGIIFDLRNNGGGSLKEAIDITGLFIVDGPVVQTKNSHGQIKVEQDEDSQIYYSGPLIVLVSKLSASAAEIFAGAIQDYGRGIVVGDEHTHGKGTVQVVLELENILSRYNLDSEPGAIKLTNAKFYRITGSSTQLKGVDSDISFNSFTDYMDLGEKELEHAMNWDKINPASHDIYDYSVTASLPVLRQKTLERQKNNSDFQELNDAIEEYKKVKEQKTVSLNEKKRVEEYKKEKDILDNQKQIIQPSDLSETLSENADSESKKEKNNDIFLDESVNILVDYINVLSNNDSERLTALQ